MRFPCVRVNRENIKREFKVAVGSSKRGKKVIYENKEKEKTKKKETS